MDQQQVETPIVEQQCDQFICFYDIGVGGDPEDDRYPVGLGATRDEALQMGIRNALPHVAEMGVMAAYNSGFVTIAQPDLSAEDFAAVGKVITDFFAGKAKLKTTSGEPA